MDSLKNRISIFFLFVAMSGTMLSMLHHHSAGLECLHHAEEQHYVQNEVLCPVAGIIAVVGNDTQPKFDDLIQFPETIVEITPLYLSTQPFVPLLGRAPPVMI